MRKFSEKLGDFPLFRIETRVSPLRNSLCHFCEVKTSHQTSANFFGGKPGNRLEVGLRSTLYGQTFHGLSAIHEKYIAMNRCSASNFRAGTSKLLVIKTFSSITDVTNTRKEVLLFAHPLHSLMRFLFGDSFYCTWWGTCGFENMFAKQSNYTSMANVTCASVFRGSRHKQHKTPTWKERKNVDSFQSKSK